jgi:Domain of unknown function (DUF4157)
LLNHRVLRVDKARPGDPLLPGSLSIAIRTSSPSPVKIEKTQPPFLYHVLRDIGRRLELNGDGPVTPQETAMRRSKTHDHERAPARSNVGTAAHEVSTATGRPPLSSVIRRAASVPLALTRADAIQLQRTLGNAAVGRLLADGAPRANKTGLPDRLKAGVENLTGLSMDDVRVHYNSAKPAGVQALAYTQGADIFVAPGQEQHLPHEAWHVVQQKQGRVKPTLQTKGVAINDDGGLERESDWMGGRAAGGGAASMKAPPREAKGPRSHASNPVSQFMLSAPRKGRSAGPIPESKEVKPVYTGASKPDTVTLAIDKGQHPSAGSAPNAVPDGWQTVQALGLRGWVRFHVLNENSGGSGEVKGNLTPTTQQVNQGVGTNWKTFEARLKEHIHPGLKAMGGAPWKAEFKATVAYYGGGDDCTYLNSADEKKVVTVKGEHFPSQIEATVNVTGDDYKASSEGKLSEGEGLIRPNQINPPGWILKLD